MSQRDNTTVLILAAGEARRFDGISKQLLNVKDEMIIERIVRQVTHRGCSPYVITDNKEIINALSIWRFVFRPVSHKVTCDTFLNTQELWNDRTIILLGDVIYSKKLMDSIFIYDKSIRVFGNQWEVFAISFAKEVHDKVIETLEIAKDTYPAKLRTFYKMYCGFDADQPETEDQLESVVFEWMNDWSRDIDSLEEYHNMVREVVSSNTLDDLKWKIN